ncbi:hypothetical protein [Chryseobacterium sp. G0201]|uniref:hypothetical protein n=1 Tax=Chryseobacterium sp. G0201 TaxID=2487065 RepID=UPI000F4F85F3|nr:hypothetical protein [Chryseobacterium sp. G0201]AZA51578.1 hypothetical protein EG348_00430 [Chryseobacterium sp. G0201]
MKKNFLTLVALVGASSLVIAQVGINTSSPGSTLDIVAKNATGTTTNVDGLLIPRVDRQRAQSMAGVQTSTIIYVNNAGSGTQTGTAVNIDAVGYYYYNGTVWAKLSSSSGVNIYNSDGTLTGNRVVTQADKTLAFNGTATNAFSVDGTTLSVDAANDRVGIGTTTPSVKLDVAQAIGTSEATQFRIINTSPVAANNTALMGFNSYNGGGATWGMGTIQNSASATDNNFHIMFSSGGNYNKFFTIRPNTGFTGILTATPQRTLHVNGSLQVTNELNVGGNGTTAGSAGTAGQILTSAGAGTAPTWQALPASVNIYNSDGTLTGNRTVTQGANRLTFNGTATNAFSVDGTTLSVDAANDRIGIGNAAPANKLHVTAGSDPLRLDGVVAGNSGTDQLMAINPSGVVKKLGTVEDLGIPRPAVFRLDTDQNDFLNGIGIGGSQVVPMSMITNGISGLTYNAATSTVTLPQGIYQISFVYEGVHNSPGCTISSYFVNFPLNNVEQRVHSTAVHSEGVVSNHGGTVNYTTTVPAGQTWQIRLGRGQSGNCSGPGMTLVKLSTQVLIYKIGNN